MVDREGNDANANLDFVLTDTARLVELLRTEGRTVLVHCHGAYSGPPTVGALYGARQRGISTAEARTDVLTRLPGANPNRDFAQR